MFRPSRIRRILKWTGVGLSLLLIATWVLSLWCEMKCYPTTQTRIGLRVGQITAMRSSADWLQVFRGDPYRGDMTWHGFDGFGFARPLEFHHVPIGDANEVRSVIIALWLLLLLTAIPTAWLWHRDRGWIRPGCCLRCGYDLTGNTSGVCSECGLAKPPPAIE